MSERAPDHQRLSIASMARDLTMRCGQDVTHSGAEQEFYETCWTSRDNRRNVWFVTLTSNGLYSGTIFTLDFRGSDTSDSHRCSYNRAKDVFSYESPIEQPVAWDERDISRKMFGWLALRSAPDGVQHDVRGIERQRLLESEKMIARLAVNSVLETPEGAELLAQLAATHDINKTNELLEIFYGLTQQMKLYASPIITRQVLRPLIETSRPEWSSHIM